MTTMCQTYKTSPSSREGDIWLLGDHRLMCGDSTNLEHVERLVDNQHVDMVWTDPPYNVDYAGQDQRLPQNR